MKKLIAIIVVTTFTLNSCRSEYIELRSRNYMKIYNNEIKVKIIPCKNKMIVKTVYHDPITERQQNPNRLVIKSNEKIKKRIVNSKQDYFKIIESFAKIDESLMKFPKTEIDSTGLHTLIFGFCASPSISLVHKDKRVKKTILGRAMIEEYGYFYVASKMILEEAGLELKDLDR